MKSLIKSKTHLERARKFVVNLFFVESIYADRYNCRKDFGSIIKKAL